MRVVYEIIFSNAPKTLYFARYFLMAGIAEQNASLEKSPTKKVKTQCNHVFAAMIAYCKLEMLKFKTGLNHFAIKYKLIVRANQIAMQELKNMAC